MARKIVGFHIDMNVGQFTRTYLERWLKRLAGAGYNAIVWEVENNIEWETVPECNSPDAFSKREFREILAYSRELGLEPIPLLQIIGHAEYVLKHEKYAHLRELPEKISQYCPLNPKVMTLLTKWIGEYLEVFGEVKRFHLGADEAYNLGRCPQCRAFAEAQSKSRLYINHVNALAAPLLKRGITPIIWGDMALHYPQALDELSRKIMICDWMYDTTAKNEWVMVWGKGGTRPEELNEATLARFGKFIFPADARWAVSPLPPAPPSRGGGSAGGAGAPDGQIASCGKPFNVFYTTDYLKAEGFQVVTCPGSSSYGDNVFAPNEPLHEDNTWDFGGKGLADAAGTILTSWSVHLHPWEQQWACIGMPGYRAAHPRATIDDYRREFAISNFGEEMPEFFEAAFLLSPRSRYAHTASLGYDKSCPEVATDYIRTDLRKLFDSNRPEFEKQLAQCEEALVKYTEGRRLLYSLRPRVNMGGEYLDAWTLGADTLAHRARSVIYLMRRLRGETVGEAQALIAELDILERRMRAEYTAIHRPARREEMMRWMFASLREALKAE
jgi:hypothetical protein